MSGNASSARRPNSDAPPADSPPGGARPACSPHGDTQPAKTPPADAPRGGAPPADAPRGGAPPADAPRGGAPPAAFEPHLPAKEVDAALHRALADLQRAEQSVVLWFSEISRRQLFRELGYASIHQYAAESLGFSSSRTFRFLRLAADLERLPRLRESLTTGEIGWTKAREVAKIASAATEGRWIEVARRSSRRELERKVKGARLQAKAQRRADPRQPQLAEAVAAVTPAHATANGLGVVTAPAAGAVVEAGTIAAAGNHASSCTIAAANSVASSGAIAAPAATPAIDIPGISDELPPDDAPVSLVFRLDPIQLSRYEALMERIRKARVVAPALPREEILLQALESLLLTARNQAPGAGGNASAAADAEADTEPPCAANPGGAATAAGHAQTKIASQTGDGLGVEAEQHPDPTLEAGEPAGAAETDAGREWPRRQSATHYKIVIYRCSACGGAVVPSAFGPKAVAPAQLAAITCDANIEQPDGRNAATIPPSIRRAVLARDHYRCRAPGCGSTRFLEVHHIRPRERGGTNRPENLVTLCSTCHQHWHARQLDGQPLKRLALRRRVATEATGLGSRP